MSRFSSSRLVRAMKASVSSRPSLSMTARSSASIRAGDKVIVMAKSLFLQDLNDILEEAPR